MRLLVPPLVMALLGVGLVSCGGTNAQTSVTSRPSSAEISKTSAAKAEDADGDNDNHSGSHYDQDDDPVLYFGRAASTAEERTIATLLKRYYSAAAAGDGAVACPLIYSLAVETVAEEQGQLPGPSGLRPGVCATVISKLFERVHQLFVGDAKTLTVTRARVSGDRGVVLLSFKSGPERRMLIDREHGSWKVGLLSDIAVP